MRYAGALILLVTILGARPSAQEPSSREQRIATVQQAARLAGLDFTQDEARMLLGTLRQQRRQLQRLRDRELPNELAPAFGFAPLAPPSRRALAPTAITLPEVERPAKLESLAFADIRTLASLIRSREVSCVELTSMFLSRIQRVDRQLKCVVTLTKNRALQRAAALDRELADGRWRGLLHGIPYGAKDLFAAAGYPTTWGAAPYREQRIDRDAAVIRRLDDAGAVLIAKTTLGALAMGDVWFGGKTRSPWDPKRGSSGSSAGSASATAAGAVPFALGTETLGSIISPSHRCGCSSLRPTFGRVSRDGAMALSWTMDKVGPICRSLDDAAIVFEAIQGHDRRDPFSRAGDFRASGPQSIRGLRVGIIESLRERDDAYGGVLADLEKLGVELVPIELPSAPLREMLIILHAEAAAAFDELTRSDRDDELTRQSGDAWPNRFRAARMIPAVEYIQANRIRRQVMTAMRDVMAKVDCYVHPAFAGTSLVLTNLTGHPTVIAPAGAATDRGQVPSVCFTGPIDGEAQLLAVASAWQRMTGHHRAHPSMDWDRDE